MKSKITLISRLFVIFLTGASTMQCKERHGAIKPDCDINAGPCSKKIIEEDLHVILTVNPKPLKTMKELVFSITALKAGRPITDASITLTLTMPGMFMGLNRPILAHKGNGRYDGKGVLPACPHGGTIWKADIKIIKKDQPVSVSYIFRIE